MDLTQRRGGGGRVLETLEARLPAWTKFARHPPLDEGPAHRRRVGLKLRQFLGVFLRQGVGMVDRICATFISGPFSPPSAARSSAAWRSRSTRIPSTRSPARRAASPPTAVPTRAYRATRPPCVLIVFRHAHKVVRPPA
ncbi:hypothetical protein, partial [Azospirillum sp. INR13]|uniref:hypothetical protein n=1 Tax=Azospirillum sp. INR13 TaxID=2596919 RepID=UPI00351C1E9D